MSFRKKLLRREDGAVAVELAIVFPILAMLVFGAIDFGITISREEQYVSAARDGARYAAVNCGINSAGCTTSQIWLRIGSSYGCPDASCLTSPLSVNGDSSATAGGFCHDPNNYGALVTVSWTQDIPWFIPLFGAPTVSPTITSSFRCE